VAKAKSGKLVITIDGSAKDIARMKKLIAGMKKPSRKKKTTKKKKVVKKKKTTRRKTTRKRKR